MKIRKYSHMLDQRRNPFFVDANSSKPANGIFYKVVFNKCVVRTFKKGDFHGVQLKMAFN